MNFEEFMQDKYQLGSKLHVMVRGDGYKDAAIFFTDTFISLTVNDPKLGWVETTFTTFPVAMAAMIEYLQK